MPSALKPAREAGLLPSFPFGSDFTEAEQRLIPALQMLQDAQRAPQRLAGLLWQGLTRTGPMPPTVNAWRGSASTGRRHGPNAPTARWSARRWQEPVVDDHVVQPMRDREDPRLRNVAEAFLISRARGCRPASRDDVAVDRHSTGSCSPACASR